jgi:hypothetical protein
VPFENNPSGNSRRDRAAQVAVLPAKLTEDGEALKTYLLTTGPGGGPWKELGFDEMPSLPHEKDDRWLLMDMYIKGWGLVEKRMRTHKLLRTSHDAVPGDELVPRCATCNGRVVHAVHRQTRVWRKDEKTILTSDDYSASVATEEGYVEVPVEMFVRQPPTGEGATAAAQRPRGEGGVRVAKSFPNFKAGPTGENGVAISKFQVVIAAVETGFQIEGTTYDAMYLWDDDARSKAWAGESSQAKKTLGTKFSAFMAVYWALTREHAPNSSVQTFQSLEKAGGALLTALSKSREKNETRHTIVHEAVLASRRL